MRGQYAGYRDEPRVAKDSDVETYCAMRLKPPLQRLFADSVTASEHANYLRFHLSPRSTIALAARVKRAGKAFVGEQQEFCLVEEEVGDEAPYDRLLAEHPRAIAYPPGSWGPTEANRLIAPDGGWRNPVTANLR